MLVCLTFLCGCHLNPRFELEEDQLPAPDRIQISNGMQEALLYQTGSTIWLTQMDEEPMAIFNIETDGRMINPVVGGDSIVIPVHSDGQISLNLVNLRTLETITTDLREPDCPYRSLERLWWVEEQGVFRFKTHQQHTCGAFERAKITLVHTLDPELGVTDSLEINPRKHFMRAPLGENGLEGFIHGLGHGHVRWGIVDPATGEETITGEIDLNRGYPSVFLQPGPTFHFLLGHNSIAHWEVNPVSGESRIINELNAPDSSIYQIIGERDDALIALIDEDIYTLPFDGSRPTPVAPMFDPNLYNIASAPNGEWVVQFRPDRIERVNTRTGSIRGLDYVEGQPWYQKLDLCQAELGPIKVSPRSGSFVVSTLGNHYTGCPAVEGFIPDPNPMVTWLVDAQTLAIETIQAVGYYSPEYSLSGVYLAWTENIEEDPCLELIVRDMEIGYCHRVEGGQCVVEELHWITVPASL
jgi:hypothetical protein